MSTTIPVSEFPFPSENHDDENALLSGEGGAADQMPEGADEGDLTIDSGSEAVVIEKNDRSLSEFNRWFKSGRVVIDPMWQRNYVWDNRRASKLIESFLLDIPVPVVYLAKTDQGTYEVIDDIRGH